MSADASLGALLDGTYRVVRLLGRGGMGAVYEARHEALGRPVALKTIAPEAAQDPVAVARFRREAQAAAQLGHPNIVPVTDYREPAGAAPFLVMDLLPGRSLAEAIRAAGALPSAEVLAIARQVLDALAAAHRAGIVHRDIKPANIMLVPIAGLGEVVKVLDFGVAHINGAARVTHDGALVGTPRYMAPEQAFGGVVDVRADLYALGATLFHALTGRTPFEGASLALLLLALREQVPPSVLSLAPRTDPRLAEAVDRCLAKDPALRFATAEEMRAFLDPQTPARPVASPAVRVEVALPANAALPSRGASWGTFALFVLTLAALVSAAVAVVVVRSSADGPSKTEPLTVVTPASVSERFDGPRVVVSAPVPPEPSPGPSSAHSPQRPTATAPSPSAPPSPAVTAGPLFTHCQLSRFPGYDTPPRDAVVSFGASLGSCAPKACFERDASRPHGYYFQSYSFEVAADGRVSGARALDRRCDAVAACVVARLQQHVMPPPQGDGVVRIACGFHQSTHRE